MTVHKLSDVQSTTIGKDTTIWQFCVILKGAVIGENCNINCNVFIENDVEIGNNVTVKPGVQIWDGIKIEDDVFIGPNVTFTNDIYPKSKMHQEVVAKTVIKKGVSIGANATILAGIAIGEYALIGAGSVVTKSVAPYSLCYGNPAVQKGFITKSNEILGMDLKSKSTGEQYVFIQNELILK